jgi:hypothetical protein
MATGSTKKHKKRAASLPDLDQAKSAVLNTLTSADAQRGYGHAIDEFIDWYCSEPRLSFNRAVVVRYRMYLEQRKLAQAQSTCVSMLSADLRMRVSNTDYSVRISPPE